MKQQNGVVIDPNSIFDCQVKRMHEYKRQLLNGLHILSTYQWLRENPNADFTPKTYFFGAKRRPATISPSRSSSSSRLWPRSSTLTSG